MKIKDYLFKTTCTLLICILVLPVVGFSQGESTSVIGKACPDLKLEKLINSSKNEFNLSDYRGKIVLLDFWATWCAPCVSAFPKNMMLQERFKDELVIISITKERKSLVDGFLKGLKREKGIEPLVAYEDVDVSRYFSPKSLPHYVWIDRSGKVVTVSGGEAVNEDNISRFLAGNSINAKGPIMQVAANLSNPYTHLSKTEKIYQDSNNVEFKKDEVLFRSAITTYQPKYKAGQYSTVDSNRISVINETVSGLMRIAFGHNNKEPNDSWVYFSNSNRSVWEVNNRDIDYLRPDTLMKVRDVNDREVLKKINRFCYEVVINSNSSRSDRFALMRKDLNSFFSTKYNISGGLEKRRVLCLVLKKSSQSAELLEPKGTSNSKKENVYSFSLSNEKFSWFITRLNTYYLQFYELPIIDETGLGKMKVDFEINCKLNDVSAINREIAKYGLQFEKEYRELNMVVIKDVQ